MSQFNVRKVAVLGAGVMGAQIAAHLVNCKVPVVLFDLPAKEGPKNGIVTKAVDNLKKMKPSPLGVADDAVLIQQANYEEHLEELRGCDLIIEAIAERLDWKEDLYKKIAPFVNDKAILATNTSGLSITAMANVLPEQLRSRFLGIHFFNPPRYMFLLELIPTEFTAPEVVDKLETFSASVVGKGVVDMSISVFLAFFLFLHGEALATRLKVALHRLAGERAIYLLDITKGTIHGVIYGILGTALAQGVLAAIGFVIAGVPGAMLLGVVTFFASVIPVGPPLVWGGAAIWLFQQGEVGWAAFMAAWGFFLVSTVDNVIKPFIISRGSSLPFAVVFLGVLGGVLAFGVIGAFLGPTLLALGYRLLGEWTSPGVESSTDQL